MNTYLVKVIKTEYFYVEVKAINENEAMMKAVKLSDDELKEGYDASECQAMTLEQIKRPLEGTINH